MLESPLKRAATAKRWTVAAPFTGLWKFSQVLQGLVQPGCNGGNKDDAPALAVLLEPILNLEVLIPENMLGDVMSDLTGKRGRIVGTENAGPGKTRLRATVPQAETLRYAIDLRSITSGRGSFKSEFSHYEEVPAHLTPGIVAAHKKEHGAAEH